MSDFEISAPCGDQVREFYLAGKTISLMVRVENIGGLGFKLTAWNAVKRSQKPTRIRLDEKDVDAKLELEKGDGFKGASLSGYSVQSIRSTSRGIISFHKDDPEQPNNWSQVRIRCYSTYSSEACKAFGIEKESICGLCVHCNGY